MEARLRMAPSVWIYTGGTSPATGFSPFWRIRYSRMMPASPANFLLILIRGEITHRDNARIDGTLIIHDHIPTVPSAANRQHLAQANTKIRIGAVKLGFSARCGGMDAGTPRTVLHDRQQPLFLRLDTEARKRRRLLVGRPGCPASQRRPDRKDRSDR